MLPVIEGLLGNPELTDDLSGLSAVLMFVQDLHDLLLGESLFHGFWLLLMQYTMSRL